MLAKRNVRGVATPSHSGLDRVYHRDPREGAVFLAAEDHIFFFHALFSTVIPSVGEALSLRRPLVQGNERVRVRAY